ncbi:MAG: hypothetical protein K5779_10975 [Saccharofermentans sp.]|nr:hypothetical protein [Saccharofermentans sp.]
MKYYFVNLAAHILVTALFVVLTCLFAGRNRRKKTKHIVTYFFPIAFALITIVDIVLYTAPRMMDINSMINSNYYYTSGTVENIGFMKNYFVLDGDYYYMNPLRNTLSEGDTVRVKHTPNSMFTIEVTKLTDSDNIEEGNVIRETE